MANEKATESTIKKEYIQKKDLFYIIVFLVFALVLVFSWRAGGISVLVNQISLVGSVSSILLALIAIGYAFFQANNSSWENRQMLDTLGRVNEKVEELGDIKDEMLIIKDELSNFKETSNDGMSNMMDAISNLPDKLNFDGVLEILKEQGIAISNEAEVSLKAKYREKVNDEVEKLKNEVIRIDSVIEAEIANYINFEKKRNETVTGHEITEYLKKKELKFRQRDIRLALEKLSKVGVVRIERGRLSENTYAIKYLKSGEFDVFEPRD